MDPRDAAIQDIVDDVIERDPRLKALSCNADVKGGVVHVTGAVPSPSDRDRLRRMLARLRAVNAVWDTVSTGENQALRIVDLGCGGNKQVAGAIGVDAWPHPGVNVVTDVENGLPFGDQEIDYVFAVHFLEHVHDLVGLMNEIHRVLKPGGVLHAMVPHVSHVNAVADPTHVRYFDRQTFKYFCEPRPKVSPFRPVCVSMADGNVLADLQKGVGEDAASDRELALFFS